MRPGDDVLRRDLAAGRGPAFAALYDRLGVRLYRAALGMLGRREDAEDVVQEVFLALFRGRARLAEVEDLTAYLFASLRRAAARRLSRRPDLPVAAAEAVEDAADAANATPSSDPRVERLERARRALPPARREVIALKIDAEMTFAEIARVLELSAHTAASRYRYALENAARGAGGIVTVDPLNLPSDLESLDRALLGLPRPMPPPGLRARVLNAVRIEGQRQGAGDAWTFAARAAAVALLGLNLSSATARMTEYGLRPGADALPVADVAAQIERVVPELSRHEAMRLALVLRVGPDRAPGPGRPLSLMRRH